MKMFLKTKKCVLTVALLFLVLLAIIECKRGGGRRGGTYRGGSSNVWGRAKQSQNANYDLYGSGQRRTKSQSDAQPDLSKKTDAVVAPNTHKASAPPSPTNRDSPKPSAGDSSATFIQQEKKQQIAPQNTAANAQRPVGWDVGQGTKTDGQVNKNVGWNVGNSNPAYSATGGLSQHPSSGNPYPSNVGAYPNTGASSYYGTGTNYNYGSGHNQPYNAHQQYPGYSSNIGGVPPRGPDTGHYYNNNNNMGGYGNSPMNGNPYGGGGGFFGGNKYGGQGYGGYGGNGGYGGMGGWGGNGIGGYGRSFGGGFGSGFGKNAYRNVIIGLLVWNLVSGFTRRPYNVYNYYNNPEQIPVEIPLPANTIILCPENVTSLCAPNTAALCTSNGTILCVALAQQTVPCDNNSTLKCVNSTVTCIEGTEESCDDKEKKNTTSSVNIPCVTNATIIGKMMDNTTIAFSGTGTLLGNTGDTTSLCVTTMAMPQPEEVTNQGVQSACNNNGSQLLKTINGTAPCNNNSTDLLQTRDPSFNATVIEDTASSTVEPLAM